MAYNLQEQEQLDELKAFWNNYGTAILAAITLALFIFAGYRGWGWYQTSQATAAAGIYAELSSAVSARNLEQVRSRSADLLDRYGSTAYGQMAGLMAARGYVDGNDPAAAKVALQWVIDHAKDLEFKQIARLRLAGLLLDEKAYDDALKTIDPAAVGTASGEMAAGFADRRADILVAQGQVDAAKAEYRQALDQLPQQAALRQLVQLKLDAL
ncbi:MAG: YfgM family protein [Lautropia sp.]